jgi:hypothetical protein
MSGPEGSTAQERAEAYGRTALDRETAAIVNAPRGSQTRTLHKACYAIGGLIPAGAIDESEAKARLVEAALSMRSYGERWRSADLRAKVEASIQRGIASPRTAPNGRNGRRGDLQGAPRSAPNDRPAATTTAMAMRLWGEAIDPRGTLAEAYLRARALELDEEIAGSVLRWHLRIGALLALFRSIATGEPQAVSRIFLDAHGVKIGRKFLGPVAGAAVMLDPFDAVTHGLFVSEGVETGMAARRLDMRPVWALGDAGGVERLPVLGGVEALTILAENGCAANAAAVKACGERWSAAGREVFVDHSTLGKDLNDALMMTAKREDRAAGKGARSEETRPHSEKNHVETGP